MSHSIHHEILRKRGHLTLVGKETKMSDDEEHEVDHARGEALQGEIAERLIELAEIIGPEDTFAYVAKIATQMATEIEEGV